MNTTFFDIDLLSEAEQKKDILGSLRKKSDKKDEITGDMTDKEIAEFVSGKLIEIIKKQFEETKAKCENRELDQD